MWKDGPAPLVALQALARAEVETVVTTVLDDPIDGATLHFLWESSRGNALFLRELVRHGVESGALRDGDGIWQWRGRLEPSERLHNLVAMRMGTLNDAERAALELVAVGQPLSVECLRRMDVTDLVAQLQRRGLVTSDRREQDVVALAHPLFGEILRDRMPSTRRDEVQLELADALEATCDGSPSDHFRVALWRVDAGDRTRPEQTAGCGRSGAAALGTRRRRAARPRRARFRRRDGSGVLARRGAERPEPLRRGARCLSCRPQHDGIGSHASARSQRTRRAC